MTTLRRKEVFRYDSRAEEFVEALAYELLPLNCNFGEEAQATFTDYEGVLRRRLYFDLRGLHDVK
jgi:hypothetical protein